jgi:hypothetical protein
VALPASQGWYKYSALIGVAVVVLGEHWAIDVVAGWLLGWWVARVAYPRLEPLFERLKRWGGRGKPRAVPETKVAVFLAKLIGNDLRAQERPEEPEFPPA